MFDLLVSGGTLVTPAGQWRADVGIRGGRIAALGDPGSLGASQEQVEAGRKFVLPGLVDAHVHLRDPGFTHKEDFRSGTMAAAAGGVTTVMAIPNTQPPLTTPEAFRAAAAAGAEKAVVDFALFAGACIADPEGVSALAGSGAIGYDLFDDPFAQGTGPWLELFRRVRGTGLPLAFYLSDKALQDDTRGELARRGASEVERFAGATTGTTEVLAIARILPLAARFGVPVILRAVTTPEAIVFIRHMRRAYPEARVAVEVCLHYLFLTLDDVVAMGTRAQMLPPLRSAADRRALWEAVRDGTVDYIGTDHAPHAPAEKARGDLFKSPPGIIGLETMLPLLLTARAQGRLALTDIVRLCCEAPARAFGLYPRKGAIAVGADADLVLVDAEAPGRIDAGRFYSRGDRGPFDGWDVSGRPTLTVRRGQTVMRDGVVEAAAGGRFLSPERR